MFVQAERRVHRHGEHCRSQRWRDLSANNAMALSRLGILSDGSFAGLAVAAVRGLFAAVTLGGLTHPIAARGT